MKLRLRENSIRLRLLRSEVEILKENGTISEKIIFSMAQELIYTITVSENSSEIFAKFEESEITVKIPQQTAREWIETDSVGLESEQKISEGKFLKILIEKDFVCLDRPFDKDNADAFSHPKMEC